MNHQSARGAGTDRPGATDTTMKIWAAIDATGTAGITRDELFREVEHSIPVGYARRLHWRYIERNRHPSPTSNSSVQKQAKGPPPMAYEDVPAGQARRFVLSQSLSNLVRDQGGGAAIARDEEGRYRTLRPIKRYQGDRRAVDATGIIASTHMAAIEALRVMGIAAERVNPRKPNVTAKEWAAALREHELLQRWVRAGLPGVEDAGPAES
jgi:hypothetical protein